MLLEARGLHIAFGGVVAVDDVSFSVSAGEILGMVGANGSGKTTCLNMLTRLIAPLRGSMWLDGRDYTAIAPDKLVGLGVSRTFQNLRLFKDLTVAENVALGVQAGVRAGKAAGGERAIRQRVEELLQQGGIAEHANLLPAALPYGTQRVVEIARALASGPRLMFLDEPFAGMSSDEARSLSRLLLEVRSSSGMALVIVDHNVEVLVGVVERLIALAEGRVIAEGDSQSVLANPDVVRSYVGTDV
jgi:branched-chain amino acid transport system ATP-binding protein